MSPLETMQKPVQLKGSLLRTGDQKQTAVSDKLLFSVKIIQ